MDAKGCVETLERAADEWGDEPGCFLCLYFLGEPLLHKGLEELIGYLDVVRLRAGYAFLKSELKGPSVGLGFQVGGISVDFARIFFTSSNFDEPVYISIRTTL